MKKVIFNFLLMVTTISLFSQNFEKNQYSTEINCEYPFTYDAYRRITEAEVGIDLLRYKTIIRNGIIEEIEEPYLNDLQLGALSKTELKLFRNLFYAKKGYVFNDEELTKYFKQFPWYKPQSKNITFTNLENTAINRIKLFEAESTTTYTFEKENITWEVWNGGANERGPLLKLNKDSSFEYTPGQTINRVQKVRGKWSISNNKLILMAESEEVIFGGYDNYDTFKNGTSVIIKYGDPVKITLPINESEAYKKYNLNWTDKWLMIGSSDYYVSKE
ncbi:MAG: YARHG domain-containing protein [Treponema sp.]|nr:YARHG domain-containing protein [Treponema sp.]